VKLIGALVTMLVSTATGTPADTRRKSQLKNFIHPGSKARRERPMSVFGPSGPRMSRRSVFTRAAGADLSVVDGSSRRPDAA